MPQTEAKFQVNSFTGGLNTDSNPLGDTGPISTDEDNCVIMYHGGRKRRRGLTVEPGYQLGTAISSANASAFAFHIYEWNNVAEERNLDFVVFQQGDDLVFYDNSFTALSAGRKSFTVDLQSFRTSAASTADVANSPVSMTSGKGVLFVCGAAIEPFYVEYDVATDSIATTQITIKIRDFEEQSTSITAIEEVPYPTTAAHMYDLFNQGWYQLGVWWRVGSTTVRDNSSVLVWYAEDPHTNDKLPRKNTPWHVGKYLAVTDSGQASNTYISPQVVRAAPSGNTLAPLGHFILDAFNKDRSAVALAEGGGAAASSVGPYGLLAGLPVEVDDERPVAIRFYSGRVWYLHKDQLFFSQLLDADSLDKTGKCYQDGDPTDEGTSDVVATDGGVINIQNIGTPIALAVLENSLIIIADNGVWSVQGSAGDGFSATDYSVTKLTSSGGISAQSVVEAEGLIFYWGEDSIYGIEPGAVRAVPIVRDLGEGKITEYYNNIPDVSKQHAIGVYTPEDKVIYWTYRSTAASNNADRYKRDKLLNYSLKYGAFFPFSTTPTDNHFIVAPIVSGGARIRYTDETVVDSTGEIVRDSSLNPVTVRRGSTVETRDTLKLLCFEDLQPTFAEFRDSSFVDWPTEDSGGTIFDSYIETFYHIQDDYMAFMQAPYVYTYFRKSEEETETGLTIEAGYDNIEVGSAAVSSTFIDNENETGAAYWNQNNNAPMVTADGRYWALGEIFSQQGLNVYCCSAGDTTTISLSGADLRDLAAAAGVGETGDGVWGGGSYTFITAPYGVAGTPYIIMNVLAGNGRGFLLLKINASTNDIECVGGSSMTPGAPDNIPSNIGGFMRGCGVMLTDDPVLVDSSHPDAATLNSEAIYQYPLAYAYRGTGTTRLSCFFIYPPINYVINNGDFNETTGHTWIQKTLYLGGASDYDNNITDLRDLPVQFARNFTWFVLPTVSGGLLCNMPSLYDIDAHDGGTPTITSTWLSGVATGGTYSNGLIAALPVRQDVNANVWGYVPNTSGTVTIINSLFKTQSGAVAWPPADVGQKYDGTAAADPFANYYGAPSIYPTDETDATKPWILFFPRYYAQAGDYDKIGVRIFAWDPVTEEATELDFIKGQMWTEGVDTQATDSIFGVSIYWDRSDYTIYAHVQANNAVSGLDFNFIELGSFEPAYAGTLASELSAGAESIVESGCYMQPRWEWANTTASGKIGSNIQVYRPTRAMFGSDVNAALVTGLPVLVSKTKVRGRGRALQLRYTSEDNKDFELYGWGVWTGKNTRF